jgi:hypothetical protein
MPTSRPYDWALDEERGRDQADLDHQGDEELAYDESHPDTCGCSLCTPKSRIVFDEADQ